MKSNKFILGLLSGLTGIATVSLSCKCNVSSKCNDSAKEKNQILATLRLNLAIKVKKVEVTF